MTDNSNPSPAEVRVREPSETPARLPAKNPVGASTASIHNMLTQISMRKSRKIRVGVDHSLYLLRNLVERCFNKFKKCPPRRHTLRQKSDSFLGFIDLTFIRLWVPLFST